MRGGHLGADRQCEDDSGPPGPAALLAHAVDAALGPEMLLVAIVDERVQAVDAFQDHRAAAPAVAAVRAAAGNELLPPEADAAGAAVAGADVALGLFAVLHDRFALTRAGGRKSKRAHRSPNLPPPHSPAHTLSHTPH